MNSPRWKQIDELFEAALELEPDTRIAFLNEACAGDEALRKEVETLLASDEQAESFIETPAIREAVEVLAELRPGLSPGDAIGPYRILSRLGAGGMGEVYRARDTRLGREVAIKVLPASHSADAGRIRRFEQEARASSALNHPNIISIHDFGASASTIYIIMELVEGKTLREVLNLGALPLKKLFDISIQIADGLAKAHAAGIIHRDLKPGNIMISKDGFAKILDFGIAKLLPPQNEESSQVANQENETTVDAGVVGTAAYMSPEQASGRRIDFRSDQFSFGIMLYEMATGKHPFDRSTPAETLTAIMKDDPEPVVSLNPKLLPPFRWIIERCLAKDPEDRYASTRDLAHDLASIRDHVSEVSDAKESLPASKIRLRPVWIAVIVLGLIGVVVGWKMIDSRKKGSSELALQKIDSLVVLPMENLSGDPAQEYFVDGMTDALIGDLAKIGALRVISRTSAMHYKGTKKSLPKIAGELEVDAVVEGTVQRSGERVRIRVQLIHAATERHLWVANYERDLRDVLDLQSEVAQAIAREIRVAVTAKEQARLASVRQVNPHAYEAYLKARYIWNKRTPVTLKTAVAYFERAMELDPNYAPAYAGLADTYSMLSDYTVLPAREAYPKAHEAVLKALALDRALAEAHTSLAWIKAAYEWEFEEAEKEFQLAIALNPGYATAHQWYAGFLSAMGRHREAISESQRAQQLEPFSLIVRTTLAEAYYFARQDDQVIAQCQKVIEMDPNFGEIYDMLQRAYEAKGMAREALAAHEKHMKLMGWNAEYLEKIRRVGSISSMQSYWQKRLLGEIKSSQPFPLWVAECWAQLGNKQQALVWLEQLCQERSYWAIYLNVVPTLDPLRSDPRFQDLLRRIGLTP